MAGNHTLGQLAERFWDQQMAADPLSATLLGDHRHDDRLPAPDEASLAGHRDDAAAIGVAAAELDLTDPADRLTRDLLVTETDRVVAAHDYDLLTGAIDPLIGMHTELLQGAMQTTVATPEQAEMLLARYAQTPRLFDEVASLTRWRVAARRPPAARSVDRVIGQLTAYLDSGLDDDPLLSLALPEGTATDWTGRMRTVVTDVVRPALADHRAMLGGEVLPVARDDDHAGLAHVPDGDRAYAMLARIYTGLHVDPAEVHATGVAHAQRDLADQWATTGEAALGIGDLPALFDRMRSNPDLRYVDADEMVAHAQATVARAWAAVGGWFGAGPDTPCQVLPAPAALAPSMPPAYYQVPAQDGSRPGTYFINTHRPAEQPRWMYECVAFHEAIPGHHFDRTLAQQLHGVPTFRRHGVHNAHVEGWGLYAERLADEMGLYSSPLDRLGMLMADAWRAGRLVVDTGLHHLGWTRSQAIGWFQQFTPMGASMIQQEVDRYIGMAGQALSYKLGQRHIVDLRARAETTLGVDFDVAAFHDAVLVEGSLPLPVLTTVVEGRLGL